MQGCETTGLGSRLILTVLIALGCLHVAACGTLRPFNNQLAAGYQAASTARQEALQLLQAGSITAGQAQAVQDKADLIRGSLDLARSVHEADPGRASGILSRSLAALSILGSCTSIDRPRLDECVRLTEVPR